MLYDNQSPQEWVAFHPRDISLLNNQFLWKVRCFPLSIQVCPKKGINPAILWWGWDWEHQTYENSGRVWILRVFHCSFEEKNKTKPQRVTHFLTVQLEDLKIIHGPVAPNKKATGFDGWKPRYLQDEPRADFFANGVIWVFSLNGGTPKSSILIGFSIINHPFWGTTILGTPHISPLLNGLRNGFHGFLEPQKVECRALAYNWFLGPILAMINQPIHGELESRHLLICKN